MSAPKPVGFDNWRTFYFISVDGSGNKVANKGSFCIEDDNKHKIYRGPSIASTTAANPVVITTAEPHEFQVGQSVRFHDLHASIASAFGAIEHVVTAVGSTTTFSVAVSTVGMGTTADLGVVGIDSQNSMKVANWDMLAGRNCKEDYPDPWETAFEG
jgi:hypothetical protein